MARYKRFATQDGETHWCLMWPQGIFEALRMAWLCLKYPDRAALFVGVADEWAAAHFKKFPEKPPNAGIQARP